MAVKSILDIEVRSEAFDKYTANFKKYQDLLKKTPSAWEEVKAQVDQVAKAHKEVVASATAFSRLANSTADIEKQSARFTERSSVHWKNIARSTRDFATHITNATRQLLRWASITGVISGLLGAGGLFGISRLAQSGASQRRSSLGLGSSAGQLSAFNRNYRPLVGDPQGLQEQVARSLNSPGNIELRRAGVTGDLTGKSTTEVTMMLVEQLKKIADSGMAPGTAISAYGLDKLGITEETLNNLRRRGAGEISGAREATGRDARAMNITDELLKKWETLNTQLGRAADIIEAKFINALAKLAPEIGNLSKAFTDLVTSLLGSDPLKKLIDGLTEEIKWLSTELGRESFKKSVSDFIENVEKIAIAIGKAVAKIAGFLGGSEAKPGESGLTPGERVDKSRDFWKGLLDYFHEHGGGGTVTPNGADGSAADQFFKWLKERFDKGLGGLTPLLPTPTSGTASAGSMVIPAAFWGGRGMPGTGGGGTGGSAGPVGATGTPGAGAAGPGGLFARLEQSGGLPRGLLDSIWSAESGRGRNMGPSSAGAMGHFQFMPGTARRFGLTDPSNLQESAGAAAKYFQSLLSRFQGDVAKAVAGYNWGEGNVEKAIAKYGDRWRDHLPKETSGYLGRVLPHVGAGGRTGERLEARGGGAHIYVFNNTGGNAIVTASALRA